ncbi:hypothetical protein [Desulfoluna sp.]|uniref:hypothetical protein n=1 Tax=Desulfoluna sp. TaxID=2045199 RepID=UPI002616793C|nr:hypothetical protein [Desulfoluna sp.]
MTLSLEGGLAPDIKKIGVRAVLLSPSQVYRTLKQRGTLHRLLWGFSGAVLLNGLMAGMIGPEGGLTVLGAVAVFNSLGMAFLSSLMGWLALWLVGRRRPGASVVVPSVAYGFGVTLLVSWIPGSFVYTEPWKWGVIWVGFRELGGVSGRRALGAVFLTLVSLMLLFKGLFMLQGM